MRCLASSSYSAPLTVSLAGHGSDIVVPAAIIVICDQDQAVHKLVGIWYCADDPCCMGRQPSIEIANLYHRLPSPPALRKPFFRLTQEKL